MSRSRKDRLRLVDPADPDDVSEVETIESDGAETETEPERDSAAISPKSKSSSGFALRSRSRSKTRSKVDLADSPPALPSKGKEASDGKTEPATPLKPSGARGGDPKRGGLLSRLRRMRKKEGNLTAADRGGPATPSTPDPKPSAATSTQEERQESPVPTPPDSPSSPVGPRETLGIDAFSGPGPRSSRATSLLDLDAHTSGTAPTAMSLASVPNPDLILKDKEVEKQPDYIETQAKSGHLRREGTARYSIAHSIEASLVDSWSIAERVLDEGEETQPHNGEESEGEEDEWITSGQPPMVDDDPVRVQRRDGSVTPTRAQATTDAPATIALTTIGTEAGQTIYGTSLSTAASNVSGAAERSDVDRLLSQLESGESDVNASLLTDTDSEMPDHASELSAATRSAGASDIVMPAAPLSAQTHGRSAASVATGFESDTTMSDIMPDDSVSIRAMQRMTQEAEQDQSQRGDETPTPGHVDTTDPQRLALLLAEMEPAFQSDSEEAGDSGSDDATEAQGGQSSARSSVVRKPVTSGAARRRRPAKIPVQDLGGHSWLTEASLTPEQLHYFLKAMVSTELHWECSRAFAFDPSSPEVTADVSQQSRSRAYDVFKKSKVTDAALPRLPLLRFLFESSFAMLPIFGTSSSSYERRLKRAKSYWKQSVAPLLRILQNRSFSRSIDRLGEGDGSDYSSTSVVSGIAAVLHRAAVRFVSATLTTSSPEAKAGWPWPSSKVLQLPSFLPYRLPLAQQSRGAFEVDVVVMRPLGREIAYILRVRRQFGHPSIFVIRSESQFSDFASALNTALPRSCIKRPPALSMATTVSAESKPQAMATPLTLSQKRKSGESKRTPDTSNARAADKKPVSEKPSTAFASIFGSLGKSSAAGPGSTADTSQSEAKSSGVAASENITAASDVREARRGSLFASRTSLPLSQGPPSDAGDTSIVSSASTVKEPAQSSSKATEKAKVPAAGPPPSSSRSSSAKKTKKATVDVDVRRLQLRDWLRDVLSARGVGHHDETREFLTAGFFTDKDLKSSTKAKIAANEEADRKSTRQREELALHAGEEVLELQDQIEAMWQECMDGKGFLLAKEAFEKATSFSMLSEDYQRLVSYLHLKVAQFLLGTFVTGDESLNNFRQAKSLYRTLPWKLLALVMSEPTSVMMADLRRALTAPKFLSNLISVFFEDGQRKSAETLADLKSRLPADYLRKIRRFVEVTPDHTKRLIRDQAERNGIPLVAAIERGSDEPLLEGKELSRIIQATRGYTRYMETEPNFIDVEIEAKVNKDVALILDLQLALRIYSARRDSQNLRDLARSATFRTSLDRLLQPLLDHLARLHHRKTPLRQSVQTLRFRMASLLELIEALRARVQDPARSIDALTTFLDSHVHDTVLVLRYLSPLFGWLHAMARTVGEGSSDISQAWPLPQSASSFSPLGAEGLANIRHLTESAWLGRVKAMEATSRWIAGDLEADQSVQVLGGGGERARTLPILPEDPKRGKLDRNVFDAFLPSFRDALAKVLKSQQG
ncbi:unnamed protein product [Parajaminaea phylloscopi]